MIYDPYKILGVAPDATADDIKKAYRTLSRKYHPDANINNPNKAQAEERFKEIQVAYDRIMKDRENGNYSGGSAYGGNTYGQGAYGAGGFGAGGFGTGGFGQGAGGQNYGPFGSANTGSSSSYQNPEDMRRLRAAANYINAGNYREAMTVLDSIGERGAIWYYYTAVANQGLGNNIGALNAARQAVALDPGNPSYRMLLQRMEGGGIWYENMGSGYGRAAQGAGSVCTTLCWMTLLCNCCCRPY